MQINKWYCTLPTGPRGLARPPHIKGPYHVVRLWIRMYQIMPHPHRSSTCAALFTYVHSLHRFTSLDMTWHDWHTYIHCIISHYGTWHDSLLHTIALHYITLLHITLHRKHTWVYIHNYKSKTLRCIEHIKKRWWQAAKDSSTSKRH